MQNSLLISLLAGNLQSETGSQLTCFLRQSLPTNVLCLRAEAHAIILPHVARFNLAQSPDIAARLAAAFGAPDAVTALETMLQRFPIPQRLRDVSFERSKIESAAAQVAALKITSPRPVSAADVSALLTAAY